MCGSSAKVVFVVLGLLLMGFSSWKGGTADALTPAECKEERRILVNACKALITKRPPTAFCCERLRVTHVECVCPVITPILAALIDVNYAIKVIQGCGRQVPRHFKCGSITTP